MNKRLENFAIVLKTNTVPIISKIFELITKSNGVRKEADTPATETDMPVKNPKK